MISAANLIPLANLNVHRLHLLHLLAPFSSPIPSTAFDAMEDDMQNSSDLEFDAPVDRFKDAGSKSIASMIESAVQDRYTSKKAVKTLAFVEGDATTQAANALWFRRFQAFRGNTLKVRYVEICMGKGPPSTMDLTAQIHGYGCSQAMSYLLQRTTTVPSPSKRR